MTRLTFRRPLAIILMALTNVVAAGCLPPSGRAPAGATPSFTGGAAPSSADVNGVPTARPSIVRPTPTPGPTFALYTVATGDNLNSIARKFGTTARSIAFWNRVAYPSLDPDSSDYRPNVLKIGWTLRIIPNQVLTDDEAPPLPSATAEASPS